MVKYRITGADRESGEDVELLVDAQSAEDARAKANHRGILVANSSVVGDGNGHADRAAQYGAGLPQSMAQAGGPGSSPVSRRKGKLARLNMILIPLALVLITVSVLIPSRSRSTGGADAGGDGPIYKGKTAAEWVKACDDRDERTKLNALIALAEIGPEMGPAKWLSIAPEYSGLCMKLHRGDGITSEEAMVLAKLTQCDWQFSLGPPNAELDKGRWESDARIWAELTAAPDPAVARYATYAIDRKLPDVLKVVDSTQRSLMAYTMKSRAREIKDDDAELAERLRSLAARVSPENK